MDNMEGKTFDELIMEAMCLSTGILERSSSIAYYEGLRSILGGKKLSKGKEQKELEKEQKADVVELIKIRNYFAEQLSRPELSDMEIQDVLHYIFANYRFVDNKPIVRLKRIFDVSEITGKMIKKGMDEFEERRRARLRENSRRM